MITVGIDNGSTGSLAILGLECPLFGPTPVREEQDFNKTVKRITRIDFQALCATLAPYSFSECHTMVFLERPLKNPRLFEATFSAARAFEATLIVLEALSLPFKVVDSKEWQRAMLPGVKGSKALKAASLRAGCKLYPELSEAIEAHGDADSLLIARYFSELIGRAP